jgi:hypothetical protein
MGIKNRVANAIAPQVIKSVNKHFEEILDECIKCKDNDQEAIKKCKYWETKTLYRCEKVADILEKVKSDVQVDTVMPVVKGVERVSAKITSAKDKLLKPFRKE